MRSAIYPNNLIPSLIIIIFLIAYNPNQANAIRINKLNQEQNHDNDDLNLVQLRDQLSQSEQQTDKLKQQNILSHKLKHKLKTKGKTKEKFVGTLLWDFIDVLTFGSLEKPAKKKNVTKKQEEPVKPVQIAHKNETQHAEVHKSLVVVCNQTTIKKPPKKVVIRELKKEIKEEKAKEDEDEEPDSEPEPEPKKQTLDDKIKIEKAALDMKKEVLDTVVSKPKKEKEYKKLHNEEDDKKNNEKQNKDDPIITYLSLISSHHSSKLDRQYVESVFDSYGIAPKENKEDTAVQTSEGEGEAASDDEQRVLTKGNAILAYEEIFKMWKVDLTLEQQKKIKDVYFPQSWAKFAENGNLDQKDAYRFIKDLMTEQVTNKDETVEGHSETKASIRKQSSELEPKKIEPANVDHVTDKLKTVTDHFDKADQVDDAMKDHINGKTASASKEPDDDKTASASTETDDSKVSDSTVTDDSKDEDQDDEDEDKDESGETVAQKTKSKKKSNQSAHQITEKDDKQSKEGKGIVMTDDDYINKLKETEQLSKKSKKKKHHFKGLHMSKEIGKDLQSSKHQIDKELMQIKQINDQGNEQLLQTTGIKST